MPPSVVQPIPDEIPLPPLLAATQALDEARQEEARLGEQHQVLKAQRKALEAERDAALMAARRARHAVLVAQCHQEALALTARIDALEAERRTCYAHLEAAVGVLIEAQDQHRALQAEVAGLRTRLKTHRQDAQQYAKDRKAYWEHEALSAAAQCEQALAVLC